MAKLHGEIKIGDRVYRRGEAVPWKFIHPFFLVHMLMFGASGFFMAYNDKPLLRQAVLHWTGAREDEGKARVVNRGYVAVSLLVYTGFHLL